MQSRSELSRLGGASKMQKRVMPFSLFGFNRSSTFALRKSDSNGSIQPLRKIIPSKGFTDSSLFN